jgi:DNA polymerase III delta subunit
MITVLIGENSFENERKTSRLVDVFGEAVEKIDGAELQRHQLPDLLMGATLFASKRLVVIKNLSDNKSLWSELETWLGRISDDIHLVLVDEKPDKRTRTFKVLQKVADIHESKIWSDRDALKAEQWVVQEAKALGVSLDKKIAHLLVARVGVDQWSLFRALEKLALVDTVTGNVVESIIEANPTENVFNLFEAALKGNRSKVIQMLQTLRLSEDPYRLFGLMSGQVFHLLALTAAEDTNTVAKDFGVHPFVISKLTPFAAKLGKSGVKKVFAAFVEADSGMKTSAADPWLLIERALLKVANTTS